MEDIENRRAGFDQSGNIYEKAVSVEIRPELIANVACYWFTPEHESAHQIIIYVHGGSICSWLNSFTEVW